MNPQSAGATAPQEPRDAHTPSAPDLRPAGPHVPESGPPSVGQRFPVAPFVLTLLLAAFVLVPPVRDNPRLVGSFAGVAGVLLAWELVLWIAARARQRLFRAEFVPIRSHWVQACVQFSIYLYWGWFWPNAYRELPLVAAQIIFVYALDALLSWSRGRTWRVGFGPLPIVISTNLLLWFRDDWYFLQFLMLTTGVLGKQFITWERDGKRTHVFNPSAFGQSVFAVVLIATGMTKQLTWGKEIAASFEPPHMLIVIFLGGLVVQYLFQVTLMTFAAAATLVLAGLAYTWATGGLYLFVNTNVAAPIFLGLHLLVTDPATSPRTNAGRVIFGVLYALGYIALFRIFDQVEIPLFWDKLLPVPILNLCVPLIDRIVRSGALGRLERAWESALPPARMNTVHMGAWALFFITLISTGFIEGPHRGNSIVFWKKAYADGRLHAGHSLVMAAGSLAEGDGLGAAFNELGLICMEGKIVKQNRGLAARYFSKAAKLHDESGCVNIALQFICLRERLSDADVASALDQLESDCASIGRSRSCWLVGLAYETGRGRPFDGTRAIAAYEKSGIDNLFACKGLARIVLSGIAPVYDIRPVIPTLVAAAQKGDGESLWYLAYMYSYGVGLKKSDEKARMMLERACKHGAQGACDALQQSTLPAYTDPVMAVPSWATAYPVDN